MLMDIGCRRWVMFRFGWLIVLCVVALPLIAQTPTLTKSYNPPSISVTGSSQLTFTITNSVNDPIQTGIGFADTLPSGLEIVSVTGGNCGNNVTISPDRRTLKLTGGSLTGFSQGAHSCSITVTVTATACGAFPNTPNNISAVANLNVSTVNAVLNSVGCPPPVLTKAFVPPTMTATGTSTLVFTITNTFGNAFQSGMAFKDLLPAGLIITGILNRTCPGTIDITTNPRTVAYNSNIGLGQPSCQFTLAVRAAGQCGQFVNGSGQISSAENLDISRANAPLDITGCQPPQGVTLRKIVDGAPAGFQSAFSFLVQCTTPAGFYQKIFPVQFPSPGFVSIADIPPGSTCTVTEGPLSASPSGYNWSGLAVVNPAGVIMIASNTVITITNTLRSCSDSGKITVRGVLQDVPQNFSGDFSGTLQCWSGGTRTAHPITLTAPNALAASAANIPLGSTCTYIQTSQPPLPASLQWNTPTIMPPFGSVTLDSECCREITVTNAARTCCTVDGVTTCSVAPDGGN
jgi:uncharacterized repeat protein (TIGR01451 family)